MRDLPDNKEFTAIGWSIVKILVIWGLLALLPHLLGWVL